MKGIQIEKVSTRKDLKKFIFFPWKVYKGDPHWVPPFIKEFKEKINKDKNPFFKFAEMELFLAYRNEEVTGRIAAILDKSHNNLHNEKVAFFGLYESLNDSNTSNALLNQVARWGKERGMEILRGPVNLSMNDECAFLVEGFDSPPVIMMTYNPSYYLELMDEYGLVKAKDLYAYYMTKDHKTAEKVGAIVKEAQDKTNIVLRKIDMSNLEADVEKIKYVYNHSWEKNWGFVPWTDEEMKYMAKKLKQIADPNLVIIAEDKDRPVGFAFGLPNYNEVIKKMNGRLTPFGIMKYLVNRRKIKGMRAVVFGILKEYRLTGLSYLLYDKLEKNGQAQGYEWCESSWQLEDNVPINRFVESIGGSLYKKYRIFEKNII